MSPKKIARPMTSFCQMATALMFLVAAGCVKAPLYEPVAQTTSRSFTFEGGSFGGINTNQVPRPGAAVIQSNVVFAGLYAVKMTVAPEDDIANGNRSELSVFDCAPYGATVFYRFSFFIPTDDPDNFKWQILSQIYQLPDYLRGETFDLFYQHPPVTVTYVPGFLELKLTVGPAEITAAKVAITKGAWHTLVLAVKLMDDESGYVEVSLDGVAKTFASGSTRYQHPTLHNKAGAYWKMGLYRGHRGSDAEQAKSTNSVYLDEIRVGSTLAEVYP